MLQYQNVIQNVKGTQNIASKYGIDTTQILAELQKKAEDSVLHIMLYGAYNAGKSTLINALLGKESAGVADIPKTDKVDYYNWNGAMLLDTPGVNAPIEHEEVSLEQLKRSSVILFVIRDGDMDSKNIYDRLIDLLQREKKIFIVLNNQLPSEEDRQKAAEHIRDILVSKAKEYKIGLDIFSSIEIIPMNIQTALRGRLINQPKLLAHSGFDHFIEAFERWFNVQNSEKEKFSGFKNYVNECWYNPTLNCISNLKQSEDKLKIEGLNQDKNVLESQKNTILLDVNRMIRDQVISNKPTIHQILSSGQDEFSVRNDIEQIFYNMSKNVENSLRSSIESFSFQFNQRYNFLLENMVEKGSSFGDKIGESIKEGLKDKDNLKQALMYGRQFKIPGLKGRWEKTLGDWAGKAAGVLKIGIMLFDAYSASEEEDRRNAKQRQLVIELNQITEQIANDFSKSASSSVEETINQFFNEQIGNVQKSIDACISESKEIDRDYKLVSQAQTQMFGIEW